MIRAKIRGYDSRLAVVLTVSTFVLIFEHYHSIPDYFPESDPFVFYFIIPLCVNCLLFREKPSDYGICPGNWRLGLVSIIACLSIMAIAIYLVSHLQSFQNYYGSKKGIDWGELLINTAIYMFSWEFIFRGYMFFGLEKSVGKSAIFIQAIPFALLHIGKPELEALTTFFGGCVLGYISYRTRSFLPCFIIHYGIYIITVTFVSF